MKPSRRGGSSRPFCIAGLFWRLVALEDGLEESASESLLVSMDTITSFMPEDFSWEDSRSSEEERKEGENQTAEKQQQQHLETSRDPSSK